MKKEDLLHLRNINYRRTSGRRVRTLEQAKELVNEIGFCHFWPIKGVEMPNLFHAIAGRERPVPKKHRDPDHRKCWGWKDQALGKKWWYYGKLLRRRATLVSLDDLPAFYALSENWGDLTDYLQLYEEGKLSMEAKQVYEALLEHGPLDTIRLRREANLGSESSKYRFDRALMELQVGLKVVPIGVAHTGAWNYAFIYELFQRHFPDVPEQARSIKRSAARRRLVGEYVDNVLFTDRSMLEKVFHIYHWTDRQWDRTIESLLDEGRMVRREVEGVEGMQFVSAGSWAS